MIVVENLTMKFGDDIILQDVSFEVFQGEIFVIVGVSGCGKSTLLKNMIGLYKPTAGRITIEGIDITADDEVALNHLRRAIGVLFQAGALIGSMSLARAMAMDPTILFFDEPNTGLDPVTSAELDVTIKAINRGMGTTMVIVSHDLASIMSIAHRVIMLDKSQKGIIAEGVPLDLKENSKDPKVISFFNRSLEGLKT